MVLRSGLEYNCAVNRTAIYACKSMASIVAGHLSGIVYYINILYRFLQSFGFDLPCSSAWHFGRCCASFMIHGSWLWSAISAKYQHTIWTRRREILLNSGRLLRHVISNFNTWHSHRRLTCHLIPPDQCVIPLCDSSWFESGGNLSLWTNLQEEHYIRICKIIFIQSFQSRKNIFRIWPILRPLAIIHRVPIFGYNGRRWKHVKHLRVGTACSAVKNLSKCDPVLLVLYHDRSSRANLFLENVTELFQFLFKRIDMTVSKTRVGENV